MFEYIKIIMDTGYNALRIPVSIGSFSFNFWDILLFTLVTDIVIYALYGLFRG